MLSQSIKMKAKVITTNVADGGNGAERYYTVTAVGSGSELTIAADQAIAVELTKYPHTQITVTISLAERED